MSDTRGMQVVRSFLQVPAVELAFRKKIRTLWRNGECRPASDNQHAAMPPDPRKELGIMQQGVTRDRACHMPLPE